MSRTRAGSPRLLADDAGRHDCLAVLVLGFTDVVSKVDCLHVLDGQDTLGDACRVAHASVDQPPGRLNVNRTLVLHNERTLAINLYDSIGTVIP